MWKNRDESWNFPQDYDPELIKQEKRKELESEIRVQVTPHLDLREDKSSVAAIGLLHHFPSMIGLDSKLFLNFTKKTQGTQSHS